MKILLALSQNQVEPAFIMVGHRKVIEWALDTLPDMEATYDYLVPLTFMEHPGFKEVTFPSGSWHTFVHPEKTVLHNLLTVMPRYLTNDEEVLLLAPNQTVDPDDFENSLGIFQKSGGKAGCNLQVSQDDHRTYVKTLPTWWVSEVREHEALFSPWAVVGPLWIKSGEVLLMAVQQAVTEGYGSIPSILHFVPTVKAIPIATGRDLFTEEGRKRLTEGIFHA